MYPLQEISSVKNPQVRAARELSTRKGRLAQGLFLCEGEHMVQEALSVCPRAVRQVFVQADKLHMYAALLDRAKVDASSGDMPVHHASPALYAVPEHVMAALSQVKAPQGIAAVVAMPPTVALTALQGRLLLLENVQDPGNVGTMLRTLDAAGFDGCILAGDCADPYSPKALRASMGSVFRVPVCIAESASSTSDSPEAAPPDESPALPVLRVLHARGYATLAAVLDGEPFYGRPSLPPQVCLMIGNEGSGLTAAASREATHRYQLPMRGGAESLNAAIAAAILMYDIINR